MTNVPRPTSGQLPRTTFRRPPPYVDQPATVHDVHPVRKVKQQTEIRRTPRVAAPRRFTAPKTKEGTKRKRRLLLERILLLVAPPVIVIAMARLSVYPLVGEGIIAVYAVVALVRGFPARMSFWLALLALISIGVEILLLPGASRPNNTALFVFLLLAVGLVSSMFETRRLGSHSRLSRRR